MCRWIGVNVRRRVCAFDVMLMLEQGPEADAAFGTLLRAHVPGACQESLLPAYVGRSPLPNVQKAAGQRSHVRLSKQAAFAAPSDASLNGAWKDLPFLKILADAFLVCSQEEDNSSKHGTSNKHPLMRSSPVEWIVMIDDDTFMLTHNLNIELTTFHSYAQRGAPGKRRVGRRTGGLPSATFESGATSPPAAVVIGVLFEDAEATQMLYPQGGAGIVFSPQAIRALSAMRFTCIDRCKHWAGDIRIGCCIRLSGAVTLAPSENLWSRSVFYALGFDQRAAASAFPVSFHVMREPQWTIDMFQWASRLLRDHHTPGEAAASSAICAVGDGRRLLCTAAWCAWWRKTAAAGMAVAHEAAGNSAVERRGDTAQHQLLQTVVTIPIEWDCLRVFVERAMPVNRSLFGFPG